MQRPENQCMDRDEALRLLRGNEKGIEEWNRRQRLGDAPPSLAGESLAGAHLFEANLVALNLRGVDLTKADLIAANIEGCQLVGANLRDANLAYARVSGSQMISADMRGASLERAYMIGCNLWGADLRRTDLTLTTFVGVYFDDVNLDGAKFGSLVSFCDISGARGLDTVQHVGHSALDINSLVRSKYSIPDVFLRGCGLREEEIRYLRPLLGHQIPYPSCFISYSTVDEAFATKLHKDLQANGVRCWKWDHDARYGKSMWGEIDQAVRLHDKLVLIASENSLKRAAVNREIERALRQEDERFKRKQAGEDIDTDVLLPVRIDEYVFDGWEHARKVDVTNKMIANATGWDQDPVVYDRVFKKLLRDLKPEATRQSSKS